MLHAFFRRKLSFSSSTLALCALLLAAAGPGCGDDTGTGGSGGDGPSTGGNGTGGNGTGGDPASGGSGGEGQGGDGPIDMTPINAPDDVWTWVDFPNSRCINDTPTGIGVNPSSTSDDVVIFLMGGNACFNLASCAVTANTDGYGATKFGNEEVLTAQLFDRTDPNNPLADWSYVFVPYCTGDVHAGDASGEVGNDPRVFRGHKNMNEYLGRLVPTFPDAERVLLVGVSAGGFGAAFNYDKVASAFGTDVRTTLIDDSGPPMAEEFVPACLQKYFVETWGLDKTLPDDCADCTPASGVFMEPMMLHVAGKYPERSLGLISSEGDATIRQFWGYGNNDCANLQGLPPPYEEAKFKAGLEDVRDRMLADVGRFRLFMPPGTQHVFLGDDASTVIVDGVTLRDWLLQAIDEDPAWPHVSTP